MPPRTKKRGSLLRRIAALVLAFGALLAWLAYQQSPSLSLLYGAGGTLGCAALLWLRSRLVYGRARRERAAREVPQHLRVLEECVRYCRESSNPDTRERRARLGLEQCAALETLAPRKVDREVQRWLTAVSKVAALDGVLGRAFAAKAPRSRAKAFVQARELIERNAIDDRDLAVANLRDPRTDTVLTVATILAQARVLELDAQPEREPEPELAPEREPTRARSAPEPDAKSVRAQEPRAPRQPATEPEPRPEPTARGTVPPTAVALPVARWLAPGEPVEVAGYALPGGMLWLGTGLRPVRDVAEVEPALIDPTLEVDRARPDRKGQRLDYWPSYSKLEARSRAAYLEWLAGGRTDPGANPGYVFLFFFGIERRVLSDPGMHALTTAELRAMRDEVARLLALYGEHGSFTGYARELLDLLDAQFDDSPLPQAPSRLGVPLRLRVALGNLAATRRPIPAASALAWVLCHPETKLRTPATRCAEEFVALFAARYAQQHREGIVLAHGAQRIAFTYRPASASFGQEDVALTFAVADVTAAPEPIRTLQRLAERCCDELDPLSRLLGRDPTAQGSLAAAALLPAEAGGHAANHEVNALRAWLEQQLAGGPVAVVAAALLVERWPASQDGRLTRPDAVLLAQLLARLGYGLEPDVRFGGPPLEAGAPAVLFRAGAHAPASPSQGYAAATLLLQLTAAVASSDGAVGADEEQRLEQHLESTLPLAEAERPRLRAHLRWLLEQPPGLAGIKRRLQPFAVAERQALAQFLARIACADGHVDPAEVAVLTKIYELLELDPARVHGDLHALVTASAPRGASDGLDAEVIERKIAETASVAALLHGIFTAEEVEETSRGKTLHVRGDATLANLDVAHSELLRRLGERTSWSRAAVEELTQRLGLLPDGALETLNDAAFEACGAPLCEGDDPIELDAQVLLELTS